MDFLGQQGDTIEVRIYHEALELMGEQETYEALDKLHRKSRSTKVMLNFKELNYISDKELDNLRRFCSVLRILDLEIYKRNISSLLSRSVSSRDDMELQKILWKE